MTDYFSWHNKTRSELTKTNWNSTKYIVMICKLKNNGCGGISDRLKPLPFVVLEASRYKRLLFIWWEKPKPLEEFLVPPESGVDWRVPSWLKPHFREMFSRQYSAPDSAELRLKERPDEPVIWFKIQTPSAGEQFYGNHPYSQSTYTDVFHALFRAFFTPVPRLAALIDSKMMEQNLVPGEYTSAHFRVMYGNRQWRAPNETIALTVNGINCASGLLPGAPVYFAADAKFAVDVAREYGRQRSLPVVSMDFDESPVHFDKDQEWPRRNSSFYDDTFVDLYMLAQSRCVAYSNGGYGTFGSLLSYNANCNIRFFKGRKVPRKCSWTYDDGRQEHLRPPEMLIPPELIDDPNKPTLSNTSGEVA
jgi:hypothetical protein